MSGLKGIVDPQGNVYHFDHEYLEGNPTIPAVDDTLSQTGAAADAKATGDALTALNGNLSVIEDFFRTTETVDFSTAHYKKGLVNSSNKWSTSSGFYSFYFAFESGQYDSVTVTADSGNYANISFLASSTLTSNVTPTWATGMTGRQIVAAGETQSFEIPDDCVYILVAKCTSSEDYTPASMVFESIGVPTGETIPPLGLHEMPPSTSALNIVKRCRQMTDIKWTPAVDIPRLILVQTSNPPDTAEKQYYKGTFKAGVEYKGVPYGRVNQTVQDYGYSYGTVGHDIDFGTFVSSVSNPNSRLSENDVSSVAGHNSLIYASVCSGLACYALDVNEVATANIPSISGLSLIGKVNNNGTLLSDSSFKIGDILNLQGEHVGIITDIIRDGDGVIQTVEISEATASGLADKNYANGQIGGIARRKGWTRYHLFYERWKDYSLYRYSGTVTYTPSQYVNVGDEFDGYVVEHFPIMPYEGEGFAYKTGYIPNNAVKLVIALDGYAYVKVFKDGTEISGSPFALTEGADSIDISTITAGDYSAYLCNLDNGAVVNLTYPCHWSIT